MNAGRPQGMHPGMMQGRMRPGMQGNFRGNMRDGNEGGGFHIGPGGMWWKNPMVVQRLSLTADQTKKMDDIFQKSRLDLIDLKATVQKQEVMLEPLLSANPLDVPKAQAQIDKVADARASLEKADAKMLLDIRGVLTPDQWTKLRTRGSGGPGAGAPAPASAPGGPGGPGGRGRGMRPGGSAPSTSNLVDPMDQP
jgi:Spy/CpxP family protein refolding chaperone